jgi:hypothetical protein
VFNIDGNHWALDLRPDHTEEGSLKPVNGAGCDSEDVSGKPDLTLTMSSGVFAQLVAGKLNSQTVRAVCVAAAP